MSQSERAPPRRSRQPSGLQLSWETDSPVRSSDAPPFSDADATQAPSDRLSLRGARVLLMGFDVESRSDIRAKLKQSGVGVTATLPKIDNAHLSPEVSQAFTHIIVGLTGRPDIERTLTSLRVLRWLSARPGLMLVAPTEHAVPPELHRACDGVLMAPFGVKQLTVALLEAWTRSLARQNGAG